MSVLYGDKRNGPNSAPNLDHVPSKLALRIAFAAVSLFIVAASLTLAQSLRCRYLGACSLTSRPANDARPVDDALSPQDGCGAAKGDQRPDSDGRKACMLNEAARTFEASDDASATAGKQQLLDSYNWGRTLECVTSASICAAQGCYSNYLGETDASALHRTEALGLLRDAESKCAAASMSSLADGRYLARSSRGCGAKAESIPLEIRKGEISWRHELNGISYQWRGWINSSGAIEAYVGMGAGYAAVGQFGEGDRNVTMQYPQCDSPISMQIINKLTN
jgi:hypothetical protein